LYATGQFSSLVKLHQHYIRSYLFSIYSAWAFCLKQTNTPNFHVHDLRHIAASDLYEAGNAERMIMDVAGWKTPMLSTYRHKDSFRSAQAIQFQKPIKTESIPNASLM
jgi:integrase